MKKCPYCAEEVLETAVACRHCGRDLLQAPKHDNERANTSGETSSSIWKQAAKAATLLSIVYLIPQFVIPDLPYELSQRISAGLVVVFFGSLLVAAGWLWLWRRFGFFLLMSAGLVVLGTVAYPYAVAFSVESQRDRQTVAESPAPPEALIPLTGGEGSASPCEAWDSPGHGSAGQVTCIQGDVQDAIHLSGKRIDLVRIIFAPEKPDALVVNVDEETSGMSLSEASSLEAGECVTATGVLRWEGSHLYLEAAKLERCE